LYVPLDRAAAARLADAIRPKEPDVAETSVSRSEVLEIVRNQLAEILEIDASTIEESSSFADDLEADSLALIELVEALEEELADRVSGFRIDDEDLEDLRTVRDAVDYVTAKIGS
jgi:acyl carrier protein